MYHHTIHIMNSNMKNVEHLYTNNLDCKCENENMNNNIDNNNSDSEHKQKHNEKIMKYKLDMERKQINKIKQLIFCYS